MLEGPHPTLTLSWSAFVYAPYLSVATAAQIFKSQLPYVYLGRNLADAIDRASKLERWTLSSARYTNLSAMQGC